MLRKRSHSRDLKLESEVMKILIEQNFNCQLEAAGIDFYFRDLHSISLDSHRFLLDQLARIWSCFPRFLTLFCSYTLTLSRFMTHLE